MTSKLAAKGQAFLLKLQDDMPPLHRDKYRAAFTAAIAALQVKP